MNPESRIVGSEIRFIAINRLVSYLLRGRFAVKSKQEQQRVAVGPVNGHFISICQVSSDAATLQRGGSGDVAAEVAAAAAAAEQQQRRAAAAGTAVYRKVDD